MTSIAKRALLVPGKIFAPIQERLATDYDLIHLPDSDFSKLSHEQRKHTTMIATFMAAINQSHIDALPNLEIISSFGVGYDHVDAQYAASKGIYVTHTPTVLDDEVADTTIGLLLNTLRELPKAEQYLRDGHWQSQGSYPLTPLTLRNRSVGIYGLGRIGKAIAKRLEGFGVSIHYHSRNRVDGVTYHYHKTLGQLADAVDTLINIVPSTPATLRSINADILNRLGRNGVFINVGRGTTVDDADLITALKNRTIAAAGLDVFTDEPNVPAQYLEMDNVVLLPHVASASQHTRLAMASLVADNLDCYVQGKPLISPVPECAHLIRA